MSTYIKQAGYGMLAGIGLWLPSVASAQSTSTQLTSSEVGTIVDTMTSEIVTLFTGNIGTVLTFAVSFMVLGLLLAVIRRFFSL